MTLADPPQEVVFSTFLTLPLQFQKRAEKKMILQSGTRIYFYCLCTYLKTLTAGLTRCLPWPFRFRSASLILYNILMPVTFPSLLKSHSYFSLPRYLYLPSIHTLNPQSKVWFLKNLLSNIVLLREEWVRRGSESIKNIKTCSQNMFQDIWFFLKKIKKLYRKFLRP